MDNQSIGIYADYYFAPIIMFGGILIALILIFLSLKARKNNILKLSLLKDSNRIIVFALLVLIIFFSAFWFFPYWILNVVFYLFYCYFDVYRMFPILIAFLFFYYYTTDKKQRSTHQQDIIENQIKYCLNCGTALHNNSNFCSNCGASLMIESRFCPNCGIKLLTNSVFCHNCGNVLKHLNGLINKNQKEKEPVKQYCPSCGNNL